MRDPDGTGRWASDPERDSRQLEIPLVCVRCGRSVPSLADLAEVAERAERALDAMRLALPTELTEGVRLLAGALDCHAQICEKLP